MAHKKPDLPEKMCAHCERPFVWRKKWEQVWNEVRFCSVRCRREAKSRSRNKGQTGGFAE